MPETYFTPQVVVEQGGGDSHILGRFDPHNTSISNEGTKRYRCPVHRGKNLSVAIGFINGRAWAKCWSRDCASADILAALNLSNTQSLPWTPPPTPAPRSTTSAAPLPPVSHAQALDYLKGIKTHEGAAVFYQRNDGQSGKHWRNLDMRRNPGVTGDGWQVRRFNPNDPSAAVAIALTEGEKDAAQLSAAGLIAFTAPRGAQSLPGADFTELVELAKEAVLPILLCGDNDEPGRDAMRKVRSQLKKVSHIDAIDTTGLAPVKGSIADLPAADLQALIRIKLSDCDASWQKPGRNRAIYKDFKCPRPKRNVKSAGDGARIWGLVPCGNLSTCKPCCAWENYLHVERCWRGGPAQMIQVSGFGEDGSTIPQTVGAAKLYREHLEGRLRKNSYVLQSKENPSREHRNFMTALAIGNDFRASLAMFLASPLSDPQLAKERRRAEEAGLGFEVTNTVMREDIEGACPKSLTVHMEGEGTTGSTNCWTSSHWPSWWELETTYAFSDGRELEAGEVFPNSSIQAKDWRREYNQQWDYRRTLKDNLIQREEDAYFNSQLWMTPCLGLSLEMLYGIGKGEVIEALIQEIGDYQGPTALVRDTADWLVGRRTWRKAFRPVLDAAGYVDAAESIDPLKNE